MNQLKCDEERKESNDFFLFLGVNKGIEKKKYIHRTLISFIFFIFYFLFLCAL